MKPLLLSVLLMSTAHAEDSIWYGTITFKKNYNSSETIGETTVTTEKSWSGVMRFLPNQRAQVSARFTESYVQDRRTQSTVTCSWSDSPAESHDFELYEHKINFSNTTEFEDQLSIYINDDGTYDASKTAGGGSDKPDAKKIHTRREQYNGCSADPLTVRDQVLSLPAGMESVSLNIQGTAKPDAKELTGKWSGKDDDGATLTISWDLTREEPKLVARITGPTQIERGQTITLDGSTSTGDIKEYTWEFIPNDDCFMTPEGAMIKMKGKKVSFTALCDFSAYLDVENDTELDSTKVPILVTPRSGTSWRTKFTTKVGPNYTKPIISNSISLGVNQCSLHAAEETTGHYVHTDEPNSKTWKDSGYKVKQVTDNGPFQGSWYIDTQLLKVDRTERLNTSILPGGESYALNVARQNTSDMQALIGQVKAHEKLHSTLLEKELSRLGAEGDAAVQIEKLVYGEEAVLQDMADRAVRGMNSSLSEATDDVNVQSRLKAQGFTRNVFFWMISASSGEIFKKDMGPLWSIGDH